MKRKEARTRKEEVKEEEEERCSFFTRVSVFFGGLKAQIEANEEAGGGARAGDG